MDSILNMDAVLSGAIYFVSGVIAFRILRFLSTPLLKKIGFYRYYSLMFFSVPYFYRCHEIHLGTSWDFFKLKDASPRAIMIKLAEGLIKLCESIEQGNTDKGIVFKGNTYYLNENTAKMFGFKPRDMNPLESALFFLSFAEHTLLSSISHRRLHLIKLKKVKIVEIKAEHLPKYKPLLITYLNRINKKNINKAA